MTVALKIYLGFPTSSVYQNNECQFFTETEHNYKEQNKLNCWEQQYYQSTNPNGD